MEMTKITARPFDWNDNLSKEALEDFEGIRKDLPYCICQNIGMALAKLELLENQGCKVIDPSGSSSEKSNKTGHWIFDEILDRHYYCSECKAMGVDYWDYCPYCGAKMVEPQESEKINCKTTKCENCQNHNYCDYEPQESEEKPKSECEHDHEILKAYSDGASAVLNKIIADIKQAYDDCDITNDYDRGRSYGLYMAMQIIDSYMTEEGKV